MAIAALAGSAVTREAPRKKSRIALILLLPGIFYLVLFFIVPLVSLVITSLQVPSETNFGQFDPAFNWQTYVDVIGHYGTQIVRSFFFALLATVFALLFSYPLAYFIGVKARHQPLL